MDTEQFLKLQEENERFRETLKEYANENNWAYINQWCGCWEGPDLAKKALNPTAEPLTKEELIEENNKLKLEIEKLKHD